MFLRSNNPYYRRKRIVSEQNNQAPAESSAATSYKPHSCDKKNLNTDPETFKPEEVDPEILFPRLFKEYNFQKYKFNGYEKNEYQQRLEKCISLYADAVPEQYTDITGWIMQYPVTLNNLYTYDLLNLLNHFIKVLERIEKNPMPNPVTHKEIRYLIRRLKKNELFLDPYTQKPIENATPNQVLQNHIKNFLECIEKITYYENELNELEKSIKTREIIKMHNFISQDAHMAIKNSIQFIYDQKTSIEDQKAVLNSELVVYIEMFSIILEEAFNLNLNECPKDINEKLEDTIGIVKQNTKRVERLNDQINNPPPTIPNPHSFFHMGSASSLKLNIVERAARMRMVSVGE